jgi:hypothetical protein
MGKHKSESKDKRTEERVVRRDLPFDPTDRDLPRALRRFGIRLADFQAKLEKSQHAPAGSSKDGWQRHPHLAKAMSGHRLYVEKGRTPLFELQALARLERGIRDETEVFDGLLGLIKRLEDTIGDIDYWWVFLEKGEKRGLPAEVVAWAANKHAQACGRLEGWLSAGDWVDHKYIAEETDVTLRTRKIGEALLEQDWLKPKKERQRLGDFFVERLRKLHESALALNMDDLEGGVHELRRKLRWFSIYPRALDGLVVLDMKASPPSGWDRYVVDEIVKSPFSTLPDADPEYDPIAIPAPLFYALSWIIDDLGRVKDQAQETEFLENGLKVTSIEGEPAKWLGASAVGHHAAGAHARKVLAQTIEQDKLLLRLADAIEAQL